MQIKIILLIIIAHSICGIASSQNQTLFVKSPNINEFYIELEIGVNDKMINYNKYLMKEVSNLIINKKSVSKYLLIEFSDDYLMESISEQIDEIVDDYSGLEKYPSKDIVSNILTNIFEFHMLNFIVFLEYKSLKHYMTGEISFEEYRKISMEMNLRNEIREFYVLNSRYVFDWIFDQNLFF
jgi:hypothetical protein